MESMAEMEAKRYSLKFPKDIVNIIESDGAYYIEVGSPLIRTWETLISTFQNGKKLK